MPARWPAARAEAPDRTEAEVREALERLDPLWEELFPAEQARIMRLLVERVEVGPAGAGIRGPAVRGSPLQAEADLEADLVLRHLAVLHAAPDFAHLEPSMWRRVLAARAMAVSIALVTDSLELPTRSVFRYT